MTGRDRRALFVGGSVVGLAVLLLRGLPWGVRRAVAATGELRDRTTLLAHAREELANASLLRDSAARITQALVGLAPKLLSGTSAADAGADLSAQLNLFASRNAAKLERLDVLPDSNRAGRLARIRAHVALETDSRGLVGFLHGIAAANAALAVRELRIVAPDPGSPERVSEILKVEMTVEGWYVKDRAAPKAER
jgi:hypothetical protein